MARGGSGFGLIAIALGLLGASAAAAAPLPRPASFAICGTCHKVVKGERSMTGPNLFGVAGQKAGSRPGYNYSPAMKNAKIVWTRDKLIAFIADPRKVVPGTKMAFAGQKNPRQAALIADYVLSLK